MSPLGWGRGEMHKVFLEKKTHTLSDKHGKGY